MNMNNNMINNPFLNNNYNTTMNLNDNMPINPLLNNNNNMNMHIMNMMNINHNYNNNNQNMNLNNLNPINQGPNNNIAKDIMPYIKEPKKILKFSTIETNSTGEYINIKVPNSITKSDLYTIAKKISNRL